jgi:hypothetical protein
MHIETAGGGLHGRVRDVLLDAEGRAYWSSGWQENAIVTDFRRVLASFVRGDPVVVGLVGLQVGSGLATWDATGTPAATPDQTVLVDRHGPHLIERTDLDVSFVDPVSGQTSPAPTRSIQIHAVLGQGVPPWPSPGHTDSTLREYGLVGQIGPDRVLLNYRTHPPIAKDPNSTLDRTIWLVF